MSRVSFEIVISNRVAQPLFCGRVDTNSTHWSTGRESFGDLRHFLSTRPVLRCVSYPEACPRGKNHHLAPKLSMKILNDPITSSRHLYAYMFVYLYFHTELFYRSHPCFWTPHFLGQVSGWMAYEGADVELVGENSGYFGEFFDVNTSTGDDHR